MFPIERMIPDWQWGPSLYRRHQLKWLGDLTLCCKEKGWGSGINKFNLNLRRYRLPKEHARLGCGGHLSEGVIEEGIYILTRMHPGVGTRAFIRKYCTIREMTTALCLHDIKKS